MVNNLLHYIINGDFSQENNPHYQDGLLAVLGPGGAATGNAPVRAGNFKVCPDPPGLVRGDLLCGPDL